MISGLKGLKDADNISQLSDYDYEPYTVHCRSTGTHTVYNNYYCMDLVVVPCMSRH